MKATAVGVALLLSSAMITGCKSKTLSGLRVDSPYIAQDGSTKYVFSESSVDIFHHVRSYDDSLRVLKMPGRLRLESVYRFKCRSDDPDHVGLEEFDGKWKLHILSGDQAVQFLSNIPGVTRVDLDSEYVSGWGPSRGFDFYLSDSALDSITLARSGEWVEVYKDLPIRVEAGTVAFNRKPAEDGSEAALFGYGAGQFVFAIENQGLVLRNMVTGSVFLLEQETHSQ